MLPRCRVAGTPSSHVAAAAPPETAPCAPTLHWLAGPRRAGSECDMQRRSLTHALVGPPLDELERACGFKRQRSPNQPGSTPLGPSRMTRQLLLDSARTECLVHLPKGQCTEQNTVALFASTIALQIIYNVSRRLPEVGRIAADSPYRMPCAHRIGYLLDVFLDRDVGAKLYTTANIASRWKPDRPGSPMIGRKPKDPLAQIDSFMGASPLFTAAKFSLPWAVTKMLDAGAPIRSPQGRRLRPDEHLPSALALPKLHVARALIQRDLELLCPSENMTCMSVLAVAVHAAAVAPQDEDRLRVVYELLYLNTTYKYPFVRRCPCPPERKGEGALAFLGFHMGVCDRFDPPAKYKRLVEPFYADPLDESLAVDVARLYGRTDLLHLLTEVSRFRSHAFCEQQWKDQTQMLFFSLLGVFIFILVVVAPQCSARRHRGRLPTPGARRAAGRRKAAGVQRGGGGAAKAKAAAAHGARAASGGAGQQQRQQGQEQQQDEEQQDEDEDEYMWLPWIIDFRWLVHLVRWLVPLVIAAARWGVQSIAWRFRRHPKASSVGWRARLATSAAGWLVHLQTSGAGWRARLRHGVVQLRHGAVRLWHGVSGLRHGLGRGLRRGLTSERATRFMQSIHLILSAFCALLAFVISTFLALNGTWLSLNGTSDASVDFVMHAERAGKDSSVGAAASMHDDHGGTGVVWSQHSTMVPLFLAAAVLLSLCTAWHALGGSHVPELYATAIWAVPLGCGMRDVMAPYDEFREGVALGQADLVRGG